MYSGVLVGPAVDHEKKERLAPAAADTAAGGANGDVRGHDYLFHDSSARIIADDSGRVLWASDGASSITSDNLSISVTDGALLGRTRHSDRLLRDLLADARASESPVVQLISRAANEVPELFVHARSSAGKSEPVIALTIRRLQRTLDRLPDLTRLYGLTPTEQQIIGLMVQGHSITEIAGELHKSVLTVRTHIKRTYLKLNVGTKEQLFSMVMKLMLD